MSAEAVLVVGVGAVFVVAFVVIAYRRRWAWTGFTTSSEATGRKTLWDWLQLLIIPAVLVGAAFGLNLAQSGRDQKREDRRAAAERSLAVGQRQEDALAAYFQEMSALMRTDLLKVATPEAKAARNVARTLTLSVLRRLDGERKGFVLQFLGESRLAAPGGNKNHVDLSGADLHGVVVRGALSDLELNNTNMRGADLRGARLDGIDFVLTDLQDSTFNAADISDTRFIGSELERSDFSHSTLDAADFTEACVGAVQFVDTKFYGGKFDRTHGANVDFSHALLLTQLDTGFFYKMKGANPRSTDGSGTASNSKVSADPTLADCSHRSKLGAVAASLRS